MLFIGNKLDVRQFGGLKENATSHYLIECVNFILFNQDSADKTAVLASTVYFQKAFDRLDRQTKSKENNEFRNTAYRS